MGPDMRERIARLKEGLEKASKAPMLQKSSYAETLIDQAIGLMEIMVERIEHLELYMTESDPEKLEKIRKLEEELYGR